MLPLTNLCPSVFGSNYSLEMLVLKKRINCMVYPKTKKKNSRGKDGNSEQIPPYNAGSITRAILIKDECSSHCAITCFFFSRGSQSDAPTFVIFCLGDACNYFNRKRGQNDKYCFCVGILLNSMRKLVSRDSGNDVVRLVQSGHLLKLLISVFFFYLCKGFRLNIRL